jgi:formylglycine-generating enzyme required for sulfatase activity
MLGFASASVVIGEPAEKARFEDERNEHALRLSAFELAHFPVTNGQYALFVADKGYDPHAPWWDEAGRVWLLDVGIRQPVLWDDPRCGKQRARQPVVGVSWYEAQAFCCWLSAQPRFNREGYRYRLPSEAEWEYAARGLERRPYAWGEDEPDEAVANFSNMYGGPTDVGRFAAGATPEGLFDMTGNVWEWTRSAFQPYPYDPLDGREHERDPANTRFVLRGGSWAALPLMLHTARRVFSPPDCSGQSVGFRLMRRPAMGPRS